MKWKKWMNADMRTLKMLACAAAMLGGMGLATAAGAQESNAAPADAEKAPGDCPKAQEAGQDGNPHALQDDRQGEYGRRGAGHGGLGRGDGHQRPPRQRGEFGPGPDGFGPPAPHAGRGFGQGPRPQHGEFGPGPDGFGPPAPHDGRGFRQGPPPRHGEFGPGPEGRGPRPEAGPDGRRQGPPREGFRANRQGEPGAGAGRPGGPPAFSDLDTDGDGAISESEYQAFHARMMERRQARRAGTPPPVGQAPADVPPPPSVPAPPAPPAYPAE